MNPPRLHPSFLISAGLALAVLSAGLRADETTNSITFSDPNKPGQVKIMLARGNLGIRAADTSEVTVTSEAKAVGKSQRKDGLRVLSAASSFALTEKDNLVTLDAMSEAWGGGGADFQLTVPRNTSVIVQNSWGGDITCTGLAGDIEINSLNGEISLEDVAGGVVVSTMNGKIQASIRKLRDNKPLSFTSMNGGVVLRVPENTKANVRLRTQNGVVLTDFDEKVLVTKTEAMPRAARAGRNLTIAGGLPPEARDAIREAARVTVQVGREAAEAVREGFHAAQEHAERDRERAERDHERAERDRARAQERAERDHERAQRDRERAAEQAGALPMTPPTPPVAPMPPVPPVPTISGGKLVTGTLNGGGPEISVSTMNGDVTLRQLTK